LRRPPTLTQLTFIETDDIHGFRRGGT
jgi:hypothetical protein